MEESDTEISDFDEESTQEKQKQTYCTENKKGKRALSIEEAKNQKTELAKTFILEGYSVVKSQPKLTGILEINHRASPKANLHPRNTNNRLLDTFFAVNRQEIFDHVAAKTSEEMDRKIRDREATGRNAKRYFTKAVSSREILVVLGLQFIFRGRSNIPSIEEQFKILPEGFTKWPIVEKRYKSIISSLNCNFDVLPELLRTSWKEAINPSNHFSVDESLYSYHSTQDESSPQRYIPRKPHPNGLLCYMAAFKTKFGPYLFDLEPDYVQWDKLDARVALERILQRWKWEKAPHVVADAGFSGESAQIVIADLQAFFTTSFNIAHNRKIFDLLKFYCPAGSWLAAKDNKGTIWSLYRDVNKDAEHFLATNAFVYEKDVEVQPPMSKSQISILSKMDVRSLSILSNMLGINMQSSATCLAASIASKVNSFARNNREELNEQENPIASTSQSQNQPDPDQDLDKMTVKQLSVVAKDLGIKSSGKKRKDLLEDIKEAKKLKEDQVQVVLDELDASPSNTQPAHHEMYKKHFNGIDLHDKMWYKLQNHHSIYSWRAKYTLSLLQSSLVNSFIVYRHFEEIHFLKFCERLSMDLCSEE